eukprot:COSAG03_NODE_324_length_8972_cov_5.452271_8_plen_447_part_00
MQAGRPQCPARHGPHKQAGTCLAWWHAVRECSQSAAVHPDCGGKEELELEGELSSFMELAVGEATTQRPAQQPAAKRRCTESAAVPTTEHEPGGATGDSSACSSAAAAAQPAASEEGASGKNGSNHSKKRKRKAFLFGNYDAYYSYRRGPVGAEQRADDPRLQLLQRGWFEGRSVLDIGCNSGLITFALAEDFAPKSILGVDIDDNLIRRAQNRLARLRQTAARAASTGAAAATADSAAEVSSERETERHTEREIERQSNSGGSLSYPHNIEFRTENFVARKHRRRKAPADSGIDSNTAATASKPASRTTYEIILCLSVTKWIHLNWGDAGLQTLFRRVWESLPTDGTGLFIMEPQPWYACARNVAKLPRALSGRALGSCPLAWPCVTQALPHRSSYKKKYCLSATTKANYKVRGVSQRRSSEPLCHCVLCRQSFADTRRATTACF